MSPLSVSEGFIGGVTSMFVGGAVSTVGKAVSLGLRGSSQLVSYATRGAVGTLSSSACTVAQYVSTGLVGGGLAVASTIDQIAAARQGDTRAKIGLGVGILTALWGVRNVRFCFVAGTPVLMAGPEVSVVADGAAADREHRVDEETAFWDAYPELTAAICLGIGLAGFGLADKRRRNTTAHEAALQTLFDPANPEGDREPLPFTGWRKNGASNELPSGASEPWMDCLADRLALESSCHASKGSCAGSARQGPEALRRQLTGRIAAVDAAFRRETMDMRRKPVMPSSDKSPARASCATVPSDALPATAFENFTKWCGATETKAEPAPRCGESPDRKSPHRKPARFGRTWLAAWLLVAALFGYRALSWPERPSLTAGPAVASLPTPLVTPAPPSAPTRNIEDVRVGMRVLARNPEVEDAERLRWEEPDEKSWKCFKLRLAKPDQGVLEIEMIRPGDCEPWATARPGATIDLDLPEMGAMGEAQVVEVGPCPPIEQSSRGQVVTATFRHPPSTDVLNVAFEGGETIGVTDNHLFWSADRHEFVPIGQMSIGEAVQTYSGDTKRIVQKLSRSGPQLVYNLEVYGEHVYFVGSEGLLVHNVYPNPQRAAQAPSEIGAVEAAASRRAYLNAKFGRSGNLNADINARGIDNAIQVNAELAADYARLDQSLGRIGSSPQAFGTRAHQYFETLNNRTMNRVAGTYRMATEQFRDPLGFVVAPRSAGSIGADVLYTPWTSSTPMTIYDLKTFSTVPRPISPTRQTEFRTRFGAPAQEIFVPQ